MTSKERVKNTHTDDRRTHTKMRNKRSRTELFFRSNKQKKREQTKRSQAKKIRKKKVVMMKELCKKPPLEIDVKYYATFKKEIPKELE